MSQFEQEMLDGITEVKVGMADLRAKMNMLVGVEGTNGRLSEIITDVNSLKKSRDQQRGFMAALSLIGTCIGGVLEWFFSRR